MINQYKAKPFLKWVGGKTQLLSDLEARLPEEVKKTGIIKRYIEPFAGGGALFFYLKSKYKIKNSYLIDNNEDLILAYKVIQKTPANLIKELKKLERAYLRQNNDKRTEYYYKIRERYNKQKRKVIYQRFNDSWIKRAAYLIFLNKTCFNGLFRQNSKGDFNVPHGRYRNPTICDSVNIYEVNRTLKNTKIVCGDFSGCKKFSISGSLVYFDPPYRPLNVTASFTAYTRHGFCDNEQIRLANFCKALSEKGVYVLLSNSDPTNENKKDKFFDKAYNDFNIKRVLANRMVNCNGDRRGQIKELLIANY